MLLWNYFYFLFHSNEQVIFFQKKKKMISLFLYAAGQVSVAAHGTFTVASSILRHSSGL